MARGKEKVREMNGRPVMDLVRKLQKDTMRKFVGLFKDIVGEERWKGWMLRSG